MKFLVYERVGRIVTPQPTTYTTSHYRAFYNLHSYLDCACKPRPGERNIGRFAHVDLAWEFMYRLRDRQDETGTPAFGPGSYIGMIHRVCTIHDAAMRVSYDDLRFTGNIVNAVSFDHAARKAAALTPGLDLVCRAA